MDQKTFSIIIIITTLVSYLVIRHFFKIAPRYMLYAILGIILGLLAGVSIAWPVSKLLGEMGIIVAPYLLGVAVIIFIEFFVIEGKNIFNKIIGKK